jgi:hypothetical protein
MAKRLQRPTTDSGTAFGPVPKGPVWSPGNCLGTGVGYPDDDRNISGESYYGRTEHEPMPRSIKRGNGRGSW